MTRKFAPKSVSLQRKVVQKNVNINTKVAPKSVTNKYKCLCINGK